MSNVSHSLLQTFSDDLSTLAARVVQSTATVKGQTKDVAEASGSAWLYDSQHLVTNSHVVKDLVEPISVQLSNEPPTEAIVIGRDPLTDLAVLRVDPQKTEPLRLCEQPARLGELCLAFGCPLGEFPASISIGIVSGLRRTLPTADRQAIFDVIQTDCVINPGNSGGPLVNVDGEVLGVNTAGRLDADGINLAVSADTVADIVPELLMFGAVERASLGVGVALRRAPDIPGGEGLRVTSVKANPSGPLQRGDVLLAVGERPIRNQNDLLRALRRDVANRKVAVLVWRDGEELSVECLPRSTRASST
jgi:serine protease Do